MIGSSCSSTWTVILLVITCKCQWCSSDFNVIIPEICSFPSTAKINMTWLKDTVQMHMTNKNQKIKIFGPEEICDGSEGLLKLMEVGHSDPSGQMIASLAPHLCSTAATFFHFKQRRFMSWTCPKSPGVISLKAESKDVVIGVVRLIKYFKWKRVGFTKSKSDTSSFCEEMGPQLHQFYNHHSENISVVLLGNWEENVRHGNAFEGNENIESILLCTSYAFVLKNYLFLQRSISEAPITTVLIPEWPIPINVFTAVAASFQNASIFALVTTPKLDVSSESDQFEIEALEKVTMGKELMETLLAHLIVQSVNAWLKIESSFWSSTGHPDNSAATSMSFHFSIAQYKDGRWFPLRNSSSNGGGQEEDAKRYHHKNNDSEEENWMTWVQVLIVIFAASLVTLIFLCIFLYVRNRKRNHDTIHGSATTRRLRTHGPYKVLLTSKDVAFGGTIPFPANNSGGNGLKNKHQNSRSHLFSGRGSEERPDLLKGSTSNGGVLRKNSNMKVETNLTGEQHRGARYKGDLVHLKKIQHFSEPLQLKMKSMAILETLQGLRHENLAAMLGCLTEVSPGLVWEFCSRGSLSDILQKNDIKLDWAFKLSLLTDLVRGMRYLHLSMIRVHGNLNSNNCVVDARWVLKITNYGINGLLQAQGFVALERSVQELLWVAPELLRDESLSKQGTQAGDVYSFAIIMQEVLVRGKPYSMLTLSPEEILEKVKQPPPLIRPSVSKGAAPPEAINIMRQCWAELPDMRPDFMVIHDLFKTLNHGRKANIVDTMFQMLEKYSNNLEELIRERTEQLDLERKKTEGLLNRMLPSMVAEKLKMGLPVDPEEFSEVTIYFSDIVGFTTISAYSTPFEVVDLLNDLYTCFDATINDYNVYKVETIGDAYMVVGGAPLWSLDHADQIATMALDLLHQSGKFRIRHLPYTPLRLRIGLHTGPCCAGVVGLTMPRYCLFGDTVNTASRMESTGSAWRIHISRETKTKLDSIGGYVIQYRGMTDIKGKGQLETFWLLGKEGFEKELPQPPGPHESVKLDEKSIHFGRTGKMPDVENMNGNEFGESNPPGTIPSKPQPKYCLLSRENQRSLSPAEQVAYQLLNGKPVVRGLRRQFSLDQGANSHPLVSMKSFRKAPSLEEGSCEGHQPSSPSTPLNLTQYSNPTTPGATASKFFSKKLTSKNESIPPEDAILPGNSTRNSYTTRIKDIPSPNLPVLEESPLLAKRSRAKAKLASVSLDT